MMGGGDTEVISSIVKLLDERFGLDAVWLFGSSVMGNVTPESDVDVAALFRRRPSPAELFETREELSLLEPNGVDVVDMDTASPIIAMQVLRHGRLLVDLNPARRARMTVATVSKYEDLKIMRREAEALIVSRIQHGRS